MDRWSKNRFKDCLQQLKNLQALVVIGAQVRLGPNSFFKVRRAWTHSISRPSRKISKDFSRKEK